MTRYELLDRIGVGGMAEIFRGKAVAAGGFEKPVAIKRILPHLSQDPRFVELLIAEAKVLSLLKHRNIVQIFDVGLGDDSKYFLVMEYVDGRDLGAIQRALEARRARMAFDLALHVVAEICEALEHAHTARAPDGKPMALVHRDISPSNVLLSRAGEVKLTDFGIAKRAEQEHTSTGGVRGKFAYISPEQARNEHLSPRSDVFAVGILLWELIANRRLFSGLGDLEALRAVREAHVPPPSEVDPRVRKDADAIVMAALSRDPQRRPTAGQLGHQLRSLRYALDDTSGDPATELAKVIDAAEQVERQSRQIDAHDAEVATSAARAQPFDSMDPGEMTVIRIRTADAFSLSNDQSLSMARSVIDRFEEEETRMAQLSATQLQQLRRGGVARDSGEIATVTPPRLEQRSRRVTDEPTMMRPLVRPHGGEDAPTVDEHKRGDDLDEATRLVATRASRTPIPERAPRGPQSAGRAPAPAPSASRRAPEPPVVAAPPVLAPPPPPAPYVPPPPPYAPPPPSPYPPAPPGGYVAPPQTWPGVGHARYPRAATPTAPDAFDRPTYVPPPIAPPVAGFRPGGAVPTSPLRPWMLVVGAVLMAVIAFLLTRTLLH